MLKSAMGPKRTLAAFLTYGFGGAVRTHNTAAAFDPKTNPKCERANFGDQPLAVEAVI